MSAPIIIAGSGRSGTTWILDAIAKVNNLDTVFEPLHPIVVPKAKEFACKYVEKGDHEPELFEFMSTVFNGQLRSLWATYRIRPDRLTLGSIRRNSNWQFRRFLSEYKRLAKNLKNYRRKKSNQVLFKFIRANLMLGWLAESFHAKIVFVLRHPAAVIASRIPLMEIGHGLSWGLDEDLYLYLNNEKLFDRYLQPYRDLLHDESLSLIASLSILWCIENIVPLIHAQSEGYCIVFYEDLIKDPDRHWERITSALALDAVPGKALIEAPSQQAPDVMVKATYTEKQLSKWQHYFSNRQLEEIQNILNLFHVNIYTVQDPMPIDRIQDDRHYSCSTIS